MNRAYILLSVIFLCFSAAAQKDGLFRVENHLRIGHDDNVMQVASTEQPG